MRDGAKSPRGHPAASSRAAGVTPLGVSATHKAGGGWIQRGQPGPVPSEARAISPIPRRFVPAFTLALSLGALLAAAAGAQSRSPWEQHDGLEVTPSNPLGLVQIECLPTKNGDECEYTVATIPPADAAGWGPAPNPSRIDLNLYSRLCTIPVYTCIDWGTPENLPFVDFSYFQTFVEVPADPPVTNFTIDFVGMDDGSRVSLFNSAHPNGVVVPGSYVFYDEGNPGGGTGTADLKDLVVAGETNRVVVTQVDDCCPDNRLRSAIVTLNDQTLGIFVDSFLLANGVKFKPSTNPAKTSFLASGTFDSGSAGFSPANPGTLEIGAFSVPVSSFVPKGAGFVFEGGGVSLTIKPSREGSSRGTFKLAAAGDLGGAVDPNGPVRLRLESGPLDARGQVALAEGRFKSGGKRGALMSPVIYPEKLKATLADAGPDTLKLRMNFLTAEAPEEASDVTVSVGDTYTVTLPAASFVRKKERWSASSSAGGGDVSVVLDYAKDTVTVTARGVELGPFPAGPSVLELGFAIGVELREAVVRAVRSGNTLRY